MNARRLLVIVLITACAHSGGSRFVNGPQGRLRVDDGGSGRGLPVLLVHGNGANRTQWRNQLAHLRQSRRAVAFDLRGMGESEQPRNGDYSVAAMADDVQAVADALRLPRFVIIGHSFGGAVVAAYAAKHPERVAAVVYADAAGNVKVGEEEAATFLAALRADKMKTAHGWFAPVLKPASEAVKDEVFASVQRTPIEAFSGALEALLSFDMNAAVETYTGPRLAIVATPIESASSLSRQMPALHAVKMDGVSHWLMLDEPDEFNRILDEFLREIEPSEPRN